jgi:signal transduction histidine kinase
LVLFVAWQYNLFWMMVAGIGLSLLDTLLYFPILNESTTLYPIYFALVIGRFIAVTGVGLGFAWLIKRQREHRAALAEANRKLMQYAATTEQLAASQERNRLARELHDTLAHSLSGATVQLEAVQALWEVKPLEARQMLDQALEATQNGLTEARRALGSLRASPLDGLGLSLAISDMAKSTAARGNLHLKLEAQNHIENLPPDVEQCIYRVAQEAMANVARHADATSMRVFLRHDSRALTLTIADDGRGFDPAQVNDARYGLKGLRERAEMIGAALQIDSTLKTGTTIKLVVPLVE